ncbi:hypothetical protein AMTR_s00024p00126960 [Amborella trichopoda]|uniref:Uncharacterized protein n=1 Tax=Amborella trichopoda TaxID=13333 RepID=W1PT98_AMBTC|nr:hypothetical protein AMTR_s00024p00126960 [Amborella trichopoda]
MGVVTHAYHTCLGSHCGTCHVCACVYRPRVCQFMLSSVLHTGPPRIHCAVRTGAHRIRDRLCTTCQRGRSSICVVGLLVHYRPPRETSNGECLVRLTSTHTRTVDQGGQSAPIAHLGLPVHP